MCSVVLIPINGRTHKQIVHSLNSNLRVVPYNYWSKGPESKDEENSEIKKDCICDEKLTLFYLSISY